MPKTIIAYDKTFRNFEMLYGENAIYDYKPDQVKSFDLGDLEELFVVKYVNRKASPVKWQEVQIAKYRITEICEEDGVIRGELIGSPMQTTHENLSNFYPFLFNEDGSSFQRSAFFQMTQTGCQL